VDCCEFQTQIIGPLSAGRKESICICFYGTGIAEQPRSKEWLEEVLSRKRLSYVIYFVQKAILSDTYDSTSAIVFANAVMSRAVLCVDYDCSWVIGKRLTCSLVVLAYCTLVTRQFDGLAIFRHSGRCHLFGNPTSMSTNCES